MGESWLEDIISRRVKREGNSERRRDSFSPLNVPNLEPVRMPDAHHSPFFLRRQLSSSTEVLKEPGKTPGQVDGTQTVRPLSSLSLSLVPPPSFSFDYSSLAHISTLPFSVFAQQGYVVIAINPHGSTSFGQKLTDGIKSNWGSRPIQDLLAGLQHALKIYPEVDDERLAALGASWGGYAVNWLNGHNGAFNFKAFVW